MRRILRNNIPVETYDLGPRVTALSTLRGGDTLGRGAYGGFNACHYTGDDDSHVALCRAMMCDALGVERGRLVIPRQTHSAEVAVIDAGNLNDDFNGVDALVTRERALALAVNTADCLPLLMADAVNGVVAAVHSGWRGTVSGIAVRAVERMLALGADVAEIRVAVGPSICGGCFEVGDEVVARFRDRWNSPGVILDSYRASTGKSHVDLWQACRESLVSVGVRQCNVAPPPGCSCCSPSDYFSARCLGVASGRTLSVIMLAP